MASTEEIAAATIAGSLSFEAVRATHRLALSLIEEGIAGDFVECGVYAGAHPAVMAKAVMETGQQGARKVHLFDSFQGISMPGPKDQDWHRGDPEHRALDTAPEFADRTPCGIAFCSQEEVELNMVRWGIDPDVLVYHPGWFHDTMPVNDLGPIALLRLDADLFEPTRVCLEYLYPKMTPGGWCICDDWTLDGCREAVMPYLLARETCPIYWKAA